MPRSTPPRGSRPAEASAAPAAPAERVESIHEESDEKAPIKGAVPEGESKPDAETKPESLTGEAPAVGSGATTALLLTFLEPGKTVAIAKDAYYGTLTLMREMPEVQLALIGSMATDDPEGWEFFHKTFQHADGDPDIKILNNLNNVGAIEVNAFQSQSDVCLQKSIREGFGIATPLIDRRPSFAAFAGLAALAGLPAVIGVWLGAQAVSPLWTAICFGLGAGAILQVVIEMTALIARRDGQRNGQSG